MGQGLDGNFKDVKIQIQRKTSAAWGFQNPVLAQGEFGWELDLRGLKLGDGVNTWSSLPYIGGGTTYTAGAGLQLIGNQFSFASNNISQFSNNAGYLTSASLTGYVPYTGATQGLNMGVYSVTTPNIIGGALNTSLITYTGSTVATGIDANTAHLFRGASAAGSVDIMTMLHGGNVGINSIPTARFHVNSAAVLNAALFESTGVIGSINIKNSNGNIFLSTGSTGRTALGPTQGIATDNLIIMPGGGGMGYGVTFPSAAFDLIRTTEQLRLGYSSTNYLSHTVSSNGAVVITGSGATTGAVTKFNYTNPTFTGQTASTNIPSYIYSGGNKQWLNGNIALQEHFMMTAPVYSHVSGINTITTAGTLNVYAATTTGGFTAITNNYAIISNGHLSMTDTFGIAFGTTTGGNIGLTASQKLAFWGVTPIVQPNTTVGAASYVAVAGVPLNGADTYDGYTLAKFVRAVRSTGLVA